MKNKILVTYSIPREGLVALEKYFELIYPDKEFFTSEELITLIPNCVGILSIFNRELPKEIIFAGRKLRIISNYGVGYNNIDMKAANQAGIVISNTPEAVCEPTAELCMGLMLSLCRRITEYHHQLITNPKFEWGVMKNLGNTLRGKTLGIIGMGKIGKSLADKARIFGMHIIYYNRKPIKDKQYEYASYVDKEQLLKISDVISLNCPLTPETHHLIGNKEFQLMKNTAQIINTSRGSVINEVELLEALEAKKIAGAALDVFEKEPNIPAELLKMGNVLLVPHIGTATFETRIEMAREASKNIIELLINGKAINQVN
ncbi:NAD(P)-dependent oxidoreductase [Ancylomarina longa]|uniref:Dihydrofolate reductase n=1 Tax=Ancylomarina longa TaxID=2487017 RepID=A0A434AVU0_9BACT|nr:NAD(P)-dependent oxidoreductase [Ancylomarina longa]RUT78618.1 dihydrofolate reductase [Ancylomarina longa]